jgi:hypothetical protein
MSKTIGRRAPAPDGSFIIPKPPPARGPDEAESLDVWGFRDTHFDISENGHVMIRGTRYELSGKELPRFLPWVREVLESNVDPREMHQPSYPTAIPEPQIVPEFLSDLQGFLNADQIESNGEIRLRHGHGHTQEEMYSIKYTQLGRIPDLVVYPDSEAQVACLVEAGKKYDVSLIPYGGGTNVTDDRFRRHAADESNCLDRPGEYDGVDPGWSGRPSHHGGTGEAWRHHGTRTGQR